MNKHIQTAAQKRPYMSPQLLTLVISHTQMLAASGDPLVRTSSDKASTDYEALTKESSPGIWDDEW